MGSRDTVWVRINDPLPKTSRRIIDLSRRAATELKMIDRGIARVRIELKSMETMNELYDHFGGIAPGTLRLRYFEQPVELLPLLPDFLWPVEYSLPEIYLAPKFY
ncbi:RlpA-like double-psi beta-barrel domain-containing protein [Algoriphagus namhaensis]